MCRDLTSEDIIKYTEQKPHLFILGAGATKACIPDGDKNHKQSPIMDGFLSTIGKENILNGIHLNTKSKNIETIYSELYEIPEYSSTVKEIEKEIYDYFSKMQIPDNPTLYDYLLLSLRSKDCIATFNWDPLLVQAYKRVLKITKNLPNLVFLHGNVAIGLCEKCNTYSPLSFPYCPECHTNLEPMPLLYPTKNKNYTAHWGIKEFWKTLDRYLENAAIVTIWGYSAPDSDTMAKDMMFKAFSNSFHKLDMIEIIDIADTNIIKDKWKKFSKETNYYTNVVKSLKDTLLWDFPRRSIEGYTKRYISGWWGKGEFPFNDNLSWNEIKNMLQPLLDQEDKDFIVSSKY